MYSNILVNLRFSVFFSEQTELLCYSDPYIIQYIIIFNINYCTLDLFFSRWNYTRSNFKFTNKYSILKKCYFPLIIVFHTSKRKITLSHTDTHTHIQVLPIVSETNFVMMITVYLVPVCVIRLLLLIRGRGKTSRDVTNVNSLSRNTYTGLGN